MDRAASTVAGQICKLQGFHHDALTGKCCVAVKQHRHNKRTNLFTGHLLAVPQIILASASHSFNHGVNELKMARVTCKLDTYLFPALCLRAANSPLMVLNVPLVSRECGVRRAFKHGKNAFSHVACFRVAEYVRQHVQAAAMGHTHINILNAPGPGPVDQLVKHRNYSFAALKREPLLAEVFLMQELFELFRFNQFLQQFDPDFFRKRRCIDELFTDLSSDPVLLGLALNMPVFGPDLSAVSLSENVEDPPQSSGFFTVQPARDKFAIKVPDRQAKVFEVKLSIVMSRHVERIDVGQQVPACAVGIDQLKDISLFFGLLSKPVTPQQRRVEILCPSNRRKIDLKIAEDRVVE